MSEIGVTRYAGLRIAFFNGKTTQNFRLKLGELFACFVLQVKERE